jgi:hypothetical protein
VAVESTLPPDARFTVVHGGSRRLVDRLLLSRALAARLAGAWIGNDALPDEALTPTARVRGSTHAPVVAELDL